MLCMRWVSVVSNGVANWAVGEVAKWVSNVVAKCAVYEMAKFGLVMWWLIVL